MITSGNAFFKVSSTVTTPERITDLLGVAPTSVEHTGDVRRMGSVAREHRWTLEADERPNPDDDESGSAALTELLDRLQVAGPLRDVLPEDCSAGIQWWASSDSSQGGFVLPAQLLARLGTLGVGVWGTVYFHDEDDDA